MTAARRLGVLGGTFDPVHRGHLDAAAAARAALALDEVLFVPAHDPPHKPLDPHASPFHRFALVALATQDLPGSTVSDLELAREGASYTADTLRALHRDGWQPAQIFFILGADAFAEIATWREFPAVLDMAHFAVVARPGTTLDAALARTPALRPRVAGRAHGSAGLEPAIHLVEARTCDASSSAIRARLARRAPIDDLVPAAVARYIVAHGLYATAPRRGDGTSHGTVDDLHGEDTRSGEVTQQS
jgi:nicotinate-nucleotide adenylyltransferase